MLLNEPAINTADQAINHADSYEYIFHERPAEDYANDGMLIKLTLLRVSQENLSLC